jgi:S1-C subfamily serine protease
MAWLPAVLGLCALLGVSATSTASADKGLATLRTLQQERTAMAKAYAPAVVAVARTKPALARIGQTGMAGGGSSASSGFVIDGDYVLTCMDSSDLIEGVRARQGSNEPFRLKYLEPGDSVWMMAHDGTEFGGKVVGRDKRNLLVVIRMDEGHPDLPSLTLGDSDAVPMGATAMSLGNSLDSMLVDRVVSFSYGTVSGSYRFEPIDVMRPGADNTYGDAYKGNILEVDVAVHPGDHGGPVLNLEGQVIGMLNSHWMTGRFLGCAVPSNQIRAVLAQLKKGIKEDDLAGPDLGFSLKGFDEDPVVTISKVRAGGPADKAGIRAGMQLVRVDNFRIPRFGLIREMLGIGEIKRIIEPVRIGEVRREQSVSHGLPVGTHIQLTVRDPETGQETTVDLVVGEREEDF